jgi:hypothetical protein
MQRWRLFIDESGDFKRSDADPIVAGVLLGEGPAECDETWIRQILIKELPFIPWPFHGWVTRRPLMYALWPEVRVNNSAPGTEDAAKKALKLLQDRAPELLQKVLDQTKTGDPKKRGDVKALERIVQRFDRESFKCLEACMKRARNRLRKTAQLVGRSSAATIIVAAEGERGDAIPESGGGDRYLNLLEALLQRAADALLERKEDKAVEYELRIHVLTRYVMEPVLGRQIPLRAQDVGRVAGEGIGAPNRTLSRGLATVRLVPEQSSNWIDDLRAGLVLADYVSNEAVIWLHQAPTPSVDKLCRRLKDHTKFRASFHEGNKLAHTAASGEALRFLKFQRKEPDPPTVHFSGKGQLRLWAQEQANEWGGII